MRTERTAAPPRRNSDEYRPVRTDFMDTPMRALWQGMTAMPGDLRLYGGTALALYLGHRESTDFNFATPMSVVDFDLAASIPWLKGARLNGGPGMVDATLDLSRPIRVTLMETGVMIPNPQCTPILAPNGVQIAHPSDLIRAKIEACLTRGAPRDFVDIAHGASAWPALCAQAISTHIETSGRTRESVARTLIDPPSETSTELREEERRALDELARNVAGQTPSRPRPQGRGWTR